MQHYVSLPYTPENSSAVSRISYLAIQNKLDISIGGGSHSNGYTIAAAPEIFPLLREALDSMRLSLGAPPEVLEASEYLRSTFIPRVSQEFPQAKHHPEFAPYIQKKYAGLLYPGCTSYVCFFILKDLAIISESTPFPGTPVFDTPMSFSKHLVQYRVSLNAKTLSEKTDKLFQHLLKKHY